MTSDTTRATLLSRVRDPRDDASWHAFDAHYRELVLRYCRRGGLQESDAEDVRQSLMLRLARVMQTFVYRPDHGRFRDYLRRAVRNEIVAQRERSSRPGAATLNGELELDGFAGAVAEGSDLVWEAEWRAHHLRQAMAKARAAFQPSTLLIFERLLAGEPAESIAPSQGVSVDAVAKAKLRVREFLRARVAEQVEAEEFPDRG
jgi:RNA polymerase sigma-70 factor (ECF subfamily)